MTIPTEASLNVPIAMPGVEPLQVPPLVTPMPHAVDDRDFRILVDQVETLRAHLALTRTAYFDELVRRLKAGA
jgi:hypothetical protein